LNKARSANPQSGLRPNFITQIMLWSQSLVSAKDQSSKQVTQCILDYTCIII